MHCRDYDAEMLLRLVGRLTIDQWTKHRALCSWFLLAAGATFATVPLAIPEARAAEVRVPVSTGRKRSSSPIDMLRNLLSSSRLAPVSWTLPS